jgi:hypothetical protein
LARIARSSNGYACRNSGVGSVTAQTYRIGFLAGDVISGRTCNIVSPEYQTPRQRSDFEKAWVFWIFSRFSGPKLIAGCRMCFTWGPLRLVDPRRTGMPSQVQAGSFVEWLKLHLSGLGQASLVPCACHSVQMAEIASFQRICKCVGTPLCFSLNSKFTVSHSQYPPSRLSP